MTVGQRIKEKRLNMMLSQSDVAQKVGVAIQTIYKYENEIVTNIPLSRLEEIAKALCCSPAYLMGWEDENGNSTLKNNNQTTIKQKELSSDEEKLLTNYNKLNTDGKDKVQDYTKDLTGNKIYTDKLQDKLHA